MPAPPRAPARLGDRRLGQRNRFAQLTACLRFRFRIFDAFLQRRAMEKIMVVRQFADPAPPFPGGQIQFGQAILELIQKSLLGHSPWPI